MANALRSTAGSHERILVIEVFGRYAGFTALLPTMAGAADRCVIPESEFDIENLTELLVEDRLKNPSRYSVVLVSEGAKMSGDVVFESEGTDQYGHRKLGGIGDQVAARIAELSPRFNNGSAVNVTSQSLGYMVRSGVPDSLDSVAPMAFGNLALDLVLQGDTGRLVGVRNGVYDSVPLDVVHGPHKVVDVEKYYNTERLRPSYETFGGNPLFMS
jgi:6-phosphofructokinase 1